MQCICDPPYHFQSDAVCSGGFFETEEDYCAALTDGGFTKALQARIVVYCAVLLPGWRTLAMLNSPHKT